MQKINIENAVEALNKSKLRTKVFLAILLIAFYYCLQILWFLYSDKNLNILVAHESGWHGYLPLHIRLDNMEVDEITDLSKFISDSRGKDSPYPKRWFDYDLYFDLFWMQSRSASRIYDEALIALILSKDPTYISNLRSDVRPVAALDKKAQEQLLHTLLLPQMMPNQKDNALLIGAIYGDFIGIEKSKVDLDVERAIYYLMRGYATVGKSRSNEADMIAKAFMKIGKHSYAATWNFIASTKNSFISEGISKKDNTLAMRQKYRVTSQFMEEEELENSKKNKNGEFDEEIANKIWEVLQKEWPEYTSLPPNPHKYPSKIL
jgi:hypothetical protein